MCYYNGTIFCWWQYGEDESPKSFLLEISWGASYPAEKPSINMDTFYNKHM